MANFNKVILLGNLTRDPELSYTPNQTAVVNIGLATNRKWKGQDGQSKEEACFVDCVVFGNTGENINKYLHKGDPLLIEGRLTFSSWEAQDGSKRSKLTVTIEQFQFIGQDQQDSKPAATQQQPPAPDEGPQEDPDGDIPF